MNEIVELEERLQREGYKLTRSRHLLLEGLLALDGWASAQQLFQYVTERDAGVNFSTIYRNLDTLTGLGLLCRVEVDHNLQYFSLNKAQNHHHHLICKSCKGIWTLDHCPLRHLNAEELHRFSGLECKFDVYGYCEACQAKLTAPES